MKIKKTLLLVCACMLAFSLTALDLIESIPAGTKMIGKLDWAKMKESSFYKKMRETNKAEFDAVFAIFAFLSGMTVDEINEVWIFARGENDGVMLFQGNFDVERIKQIFTNQNNEICDINGVLFSVMIPDQKRPGEKNLGVIIDKQTIAVGNPDRVRDFLDVRLGKSPAVSSEKAKDLKKEFSTSDVLKISLLEIPEEMQNNQILKNIIEGNISASLVDGLTIRLKLFMVDEEIAKATEQIANGLCVYLRRMDLDQVPNDEAARIIKEELTSSMKAKAEGNVIELTAKVKEEALDRLTELQKQKQGTENKGLNENQIAPALGESEDNTKGATE